MKKIIKVILIQIVLLSSTLYANVDNGVLIVGTKVAPPFVIKKPNGELYGVSIDLWKEIAKKLNLKYKFQEESLNSLMQKIKDQDIQIAIAAITATSKRERFADFSNGYYTEELSIAVPKYEGTVINSLFDKLFSYTTLWVVLGVIIVVHIAGLAFWIMEKSDGKSDDKNSIKGLSQGIWWATITMATIGRGDITPKTLGGKVVAVVWMFVSVFIIALIIAAFTSFFASAKREYFIESPSDLDKGKIATISGSFSDDYLRKRGLLPVYYTTLKEALDAVKNREVDALVYDKELLKYIINRDFKESIKLTKEHFMPQNYSLIFKEDCKLTELVNRALLEVIESDKWSLIKLKYIK